MRLQQRDQPRVRAVGCSKGPGSRERRPHSTMDPGHSWQAQPCRSSQVLRTRCHADAHRMHDIASRTRSGLRSALPARPRRASARFRFVVPALCLRLPADFQSPGNPYRAANISPTRVRPAGRTKKNPRLKAWGKNADFR